MDEQPNVPLLLIFYFGNRATSAQRGASRRLKRWSHAFDRWMEVYRSGHRKDTAKHASLAWQRLVKQSCCMPWEMSPSDIEAHATWLKDQGFSLPTINASIRFIAAFYQWAAEHRVDTACPVGFNPAQAVARTKRLPYQGSNLWSRAELDAFLLLLSRDESPLGKRDYAFFLSRINTGVLLVKLQRWRWEQVETDADGVWVRWRTDGQRVSLPQHLWQAINAYLRASGRLEGMCSDRYIFAPLALPSLEVPRDKPQDWVEGQPLSSSAILSSLKLYGRPLGIAESKLNLITLRRTAIHLKLEQGESLLAMQLFLDTREEPKQTRYRLRHLPGLAENSTLPLGVQPAQIDLPQRYVSNFKPGDPDQSVLFLPPIDVQAIQSLVAQGIHGIDAERNCLSELMRGLLEREGDALLRMDAYSRLAQRLARLGSVGKSAKQAELDNEVEQMLKNLDEACLRIRHPPMSQKLRHEALAAAWQEDGHAAELGEVVAILRLNMRHIYQHALQTTQLPLYIRLLDRYSLDCLRLAKLLEPLTGNESQRILKYWQEVVDQAIREVRIDLGMDPPEDEPVSSPGA